MVFEFNAYSSLLLPGVVTGAVATLGLLVRGLRRRTAPDLLLALLLLLPTLVVLRRLLQVAGWVGRPDGYGLLWQYLPWVVSLAVGPAYYLYFRSLTNQDFRWRPARKHLLLALLPFGLAVAVAAYDLLGQRGWLAQPQSRLQGGAALQIIESLERPYRLLSVVGYGLLLGYGLRVRTDYRRYRRYLNDNFSNQERLRFEGLRDLFILQLLGLSLSLFFTGFDIVFGLNDQSAWLAFCLRSALIYGLAAVGLQANYAAAISPLAFEPDQPEPMLAASTAAPLPAAPEPPVALPSTALPQPATGAATKDEAPAHPSQPAENPPAELAPELLPWRDKLLQLMDEQAPWREPDLNLAELAQRLKLHPAQLSKVLNTGCGQHFSDFINGYRVREALRLLADPGRAHYSLVGIALESGFNSKSTFNRVFKSQLGYPPSEVARPKL